jgi:hypothetical protein
MSSATKKPSLKSELLNTSDDRWKDLLKQIDAEHGNARTLQDANGNSVAVRVNTADNKIEAHTGTSWQTVADVTPSSATTFSVNAPEKMTVNDGTIGALTISAGYSQAEVQALRLQCEYLQDDVRALRAKLAEVIEALKG